MSSSTTAVTASKAVDPARDQDDEAGTDGDDEAEIVPDNKRSYDNWVEVKSRKQDRKSLPKETEEGATESGGKDDGREELEFQFDEDLDVPVGRQNKFSSM